jgi:amino acid transporter/nucleotide-binding universal stress UspA family protein
MLKRVQLFGRSRVQFGLARAPIPGLVENDMLVQGNRPRQLHWYHAGPMLFGDWGTSRLYVLGLCFFHAKHASLWLMLAMSGLLVAVGWAYSVICRMYPDGGGVYSSARHRSQTLAVFGALLLTADYVVTAALSALDAFHYLGVPHPEFWAAGSILVLGIVNIFGPTKAGTAALFAALLTIAFSLVIAVAAGPSLPNAHIAPLAGSPIAWWTQFTAIILAISGVEAVANMTGIMVEPVERTARRTIWPVMIEIVVLNLVLTVAMSAIPLAVLGNGDPSLAYSAHRDDMLRAMAEWYVGPGFAAVAAIVFAMLLLSAVNTCLTDLVSIQFMMARDRELPKPFAGLNQWGMPLIPLVVATLIPLVTVLLVPDVGHLADLYAIGVVGAVAVNLGSCVASFELPMKRWERLAMALLAVLMICVWFSIAYEKPHALAFAAVIVTIGMAARWITHHRAEIGGRVTTLVGQIRDLAAGGADTVPGSSGPRFLVATQGNPKLVAFAIEQAKQADAELLLLFVRHIAVPMLGPANRPDLNHDAEAQRLKSQVLEQAEAAGVPAHFLYTVADNVAETIADFAVTYGVTRVMIGATKRGALWRTMKGDIIQGVAMHLPEQTQLLIQA